MRAGGGGGGGVVQCARHASGVAAGSPRSLGLAQRPQPHPTTRPAPAGVAIKKAAAIAEQKDPERAVQDARAKGEIPRITDLVAPWGPKPYEPPPARELVSAGYLPASYPAGSRPLVDTSA